jgi:hypothetical protein
VLPNLVAKKHDLEVCDRARAGITAPGFLLRTIVGEERRLPEMAGYFGQANPSGESATMGGAATRP